MNIIGPEQLNEISTNRGKRADLRGAYLYGADLSGANLRGVGLSGANLRGADLRVANLRGADLSNADLSGAYLIGANLSNANLRGADLRDANLRGAYLRGAALSNANLRGADLCKKYIQIGCIGSRRGLTTYCVDDNVVLCGCWNDYKGGSLSAFKDRVESIYGNGKNNQYYKEYMGAIKYFETFKQEKSTLVAANTDK